MKLHKNGKQNMGGRRAADSGLGECRMPRDCAKALEEDGKAASVLNLKDTSASWTRCGSETWGLQEVGLLLIPRHTLGH